MEDLNIEFAGGGLKCDNPVCDWKDETIDVKDWPNWINAKCPKCESNLLTLEDFHNAMLLFQTAAVINSFSSEELKEMCAGRTIDDVKELNMFKDAKGLEHLDGEGRVCLSFNTHKQVNIQEIKPVDDGHTRQ